MNGYFAALADVYWEAPDNFNHIRVMRVRSAGPRPALLSSSPDRAALFGPDDPYYGPAPADAPQRYLQGPLHPPLSAAPVGHISAGIEETLQDPVAEFFPSTPVYPGAFEKAAPRRPAQGAVRATPHRPPADVRHPRMMAQATRETAASAPRPTPKGQTGRPFGLVYWKLFPDPGLYFRVPFGAFTRELGALLAAPRSIAPSQGIDCLLQVYQIHRPIPKARIARIETGDEADQYQFHLLTPQKERLLEIDQIPGLLRANRSLPPQAGGSTRLFRLVPVTDPSLGDQHTPEQAFSTVPPGEDVTTDDPFGHAMDDYQQPNDYNGDNHA